MLPETENVGEQRDCRFRCRRCSRTIDLEVAEADYQAWRDGMLIQDAFPYLKPAERELFSSGYCDTCFGAIFNDDEQ